jgi:hypothetical protein
VQKAGYLDVRFQAEKRFAKKHVIKMLERDLVNLPTGEESQSRLDEA